MPTIPVSSAKFKHTRFKRYDSYSFAAKDVVAPLVLAELVRASVALPIAFSRTQGKLMPVAIQGFEGTRNLFVAPDGRWIGRYVPSAYRGYPFSLGKDPQGREILCFDDSSGLLTEGEGEPFFSADGKPSDSINGVLNFLNQVAANRRVTEKACELLDTHELLEPWLIRLTSNSDDPKQDRLDLQEDGEQKPEAGLKPDGIIYQLDGMLRINEQAFARLGQNQLYELHQAGALTAIHCQLISMQHLSAMVRLAHAHQLAERDAALPKNEAGELDLSFLADDTTISFEDYQDS